MVTYWTFLSAHTYIHYIECVCTCTWYREVPLPGTTKAKVGTSYSAQKNWPLELLEGYNLLEVVKSFAQAGIGQKDLVIVVTCEPVSMRQLSSLLWIFNLAYFSCVCLQLVTLGVTVAYEACKKMPFLIYTYQKTEKSDLVRFGEVSLGIQSWEHVIAWFWRQGNLS